MTKGLWSCNAVATRKIQPSTLPKCGSSRKVATTTPKAHHTIYAADVELIADAHAKRITQASLEALQRLAEFDSDEEDHLIAQRAVAALGPEVEHFILRSTYDDHEHWVFCTVEDSNPMVLESTPIQ